MVILPRKLIHTMRSLRNTIGLFITALLMLQCGASPKKDSAFFDIIIESTQKTYTQKDTLALNIIPKLNLVADSVRWSVQNSRTGLIGLLSGLAEVERSLIQERTKESIAHRRATGGHLGGRPKTNEAKERLVLRLRDEGSSYRSIREQTGLALSTIRRIISEQEALAAC